eukprot:1517519-Pyramimonas_sp.AAC.1
MALIDAAVLRPISQRVPSLNRWHTWGPSCEGAALGVLLCRILPRAVAAAPSSSENDEQGGDGDSWTAYATQKARACGEFMADDRTPALLAVSVVASEAVGKLTMRLQHDDAVGCSVSDAFREDGGSLGRGQRHLFLVNNPWHDQVTDRTSWPLRMLMDQFPECEHGSILDSLMSACMYLGSQVWARLEVPMQAPDRRLMMASYADTKPLEEFYRAPLCCLSEQFGEPLRARFDEDD